RPHLARFSALIEKLGGDHVIFDRIAEGESMRSIGESFGYSRGMIYSWIYAGGEERRKRWNEAKKLAAHAHVEDATELLENSRPVTSGEAQHLRSRAEHKKWLAKVYNREEYGDEQGRIDLNLNIGSLHLDALRAAGNANVIV